jgi:hypothetical protein
MQNLLQANINWNHNNLQSKAYIKMSKTPSTHKWLLLYKSIVPSCATTVRGSAEFSFSRVRVQRFLCSIYKHETTMCEIMMDIVISLMA